MIKKLLIIFLIVLSVSITSNASKLAEVALRDDGDLGLLLRSGFDVTFITNGNMAEVVLYDNSERLRLAQLGLHFVITNQDIETYFANRLRDGRDDMGGYKTYSEIVEELEALHEDYPDIVSEPVSIGESIEEREIWAVKISDNPNDEEDNEPEVLFTALIHAREVITAEVLFGVMHHLVENYEEDERITMLVDEREIWFIPCHNPDGYVLNEEEEPEGGGMQRKNCRPNGYEYNRIGVDLNRNWDYEWGYDNEGSSPRVYDQTYRGAEAFSEPETQAAREFINDHNFTTTIYFHSWGNLILYPIGYDYLHPEDRSTLTALAKRMAVDNYYQTGTGWETLYPTNGDSDDWLYLTDEHEKIMAFTVEVGNRIDHFWPELDRIEPLVEENIETCLTLAEYGDQPERALRPLPPTNISAVTNLQGNVVVQWEIAEDEVNPPVNYRVRAILPDESFFDEVDEDLEIWELDNFSFTQFDPHSEPSCYRLRTTGEMATMTLIEEIPAPDTLWAWVRCNLRNIHRDVHGIVLEVSYDGYDWEAISGSDTEDLIINERNIGPGITGETDGWIRTCWYMRDHTDEMVRLRFRYYMLDHRSNGEAAYIDDIGPLPGWEERDILVEDVEDLIWTDNDHDLDDGLIYQVQAIDAEDDLSFWSQPACIEEGPSLYGISISAGWSIISSPLDPVEPNLFDIFAPFTDKDVLMQVKDANGDFFVPEHQYNGIGEWNVHWGYQIKLNQASDLPILGYPIPEDTPIPLRSNWSIISYFPEAQIPVVDALATIEENLFICKDGWGRFWLPSWEFNNIPNMHQGEGYFVYMEDYDTLIYPSEHEDFALNHSPDRGNAGRMSAPHTNRNYHSLDLAGYMPPSPDNHSLLLHFNEPIEAGVISLIDNDGNLCGKCRTIEGQTTVGLAAWGELNDGVQGYKTGEVIYGYWCADNSDIQIPLDISTIQGNPFYTTNDISILSANLKTIELPIDHGIISAYPNPFNGVVALKYNLRTPSNISLIIYDSNGRIVNELVSGNYNIGSHRLVWDASDIPSGLYLSELEVHSKGNTIRSQTTLLLIR
ncbi:MAG: M14 family zinc carboxypeptidase [Candidatus Hatepunaea meridiana]|nr:M14 family zinc carboxypeptidase [Candidatus Hatepunaea meridiana]